MASDECSILLSSVDLLVLTSTESFMTEAHDESQLGLEDLGKGGDDSDSFLTGLLLLFFELPSTRHMGKWVESNAYKDKSWTESSWLCAKFKSKLSSMLPSRFRHERPVSLLMLW
jgi:hypothetical protein